MRWCSDCVSRVADKPQNMALPHFHSFFNHLRIQVSKIVGMSPPCILHPHNLSAKAGGSHSGNVTMRRRYDRGSFWRKYVYPFMRPRPIVARGTVETSDGSIGCA